MTRHDAASNEIFSIGEVADAAGVLSDHVRHLVLTGIVSGVEGFPGYLSAPQAVRVIHLLRGALRPVPGDPPPAGPALALLEVPASGRRASLPLAVSGTLHASLLLGAILMTSLGVGTAALVDPEPREDLTLIYLTTPGPGGGGGGGGLRQPMPPPRAARAGAHKVSSPVPAREAPRPPEALDNPMARPKPPVPDAEPLPPVIAPVVDAPADPEDHPGLFEETKVQTDSRGAGTDGGVGSGQGAGIGEGDGRGIGDGSGGGTGGGVYRPGSGVEPPRILREVKPDYPDSARQQNLSGDVVLEIVVRRDGSVGDIRVVEGISPVLDDRAIQAVRQWKFDPARRKGVPVDVLVEVAVEFKLR